MNLDSVVPMLVEVGGLGGIWTTLMGIDLNLTLRVSVAIVDSAFTLGILSDAVSLRASSAGLILVFLRCHCLVIASFSDGLQLSVWRSVNRQVNNRAMMCLFLRTRLL